MKIKKQLRSILSILLTLSMVFGCMSGLVTVSAETTGSKSAAEENVNLALNKSVTVSSQEVDWTFYDYWAVDGDATTRWSPGYADEEWLQVDLGDVKEVSEIILDLYAESPEYKVLVSKDGAEYETVLYETAGTSSNQVVKVIRFEPKEIRYVKYLQMQKRVPDADGNRWPSSVNELEVYKYQHTYDMPETDSIRVASFNIAAGDQPDIDVMEALLEEHDIDFAGLQEVDINTSRNPYDMLGAFKGLPYRWTSFNKSLDYSGGYYGIGFISKTGILETDSGMLTVNSNEEPRSWQKSVVNVGGNKISIYNTHLSFESVETNAAQIQQLLEVMDADTNKYKILTGDFNVDQSLDQLAPFWMNYNLANGKDGVTFNTFNGSGELVNRAIDNVITTRNIKVNDIQMVDTSALSDHNLFYIDCELLDEEVASKDFLNYLIRYSEALDGSTYTEDTYAAVEKALAAAKECPEDASQEEITAYANALKAAVDALVIYDPNPNLALNQPVTVSSEEVDWTFFDYWAVDGDPSTRWSPGYADEEWLQVDLGSVKNISKIVLDLYAEGPEYKVLISEDGVEYTTIHYETNGSSKNNIYKEYVFETTPARYVKYLQMQKRVPDADGNRWPTSINELEVYEFAGVETLESIVSKLESAAPSLSSDKTELILPEINSDDYEVSLYGTSNETVISLDGKVSQPLNDMEVTVMYKVTNKDNEEDFAVTENEAVITVPGLYEAKEGDNAKPEIIPGIREWKGHTGSFVVNEDSRIVASEEDLLETAEMIAMYIEEMAGWKLDIVTDEGKAGDIVLSLSDKSELGEEGYEIEIADMVKVTAYEAKGILYAGTTIAQILYKADDHASLPKGLMRDYPQYEERGCMLDVARLYVPIDYLEELTKYMAFYKLNQIHVHINDDEGEPDFNGAQYNSAFRIESKKYPEINQGGEYYTQEEYRNYQKEAAKYGIKVVTEIDTPGHSGFVRFYNPDYMFDNYHLDVANEEAVEFIKSLYDELLDGEDPVIQSDTVHIGTDEYWGVNNPTGFSEYMNELIAHVTGKGYEVRFWSNGEINTGMKILKDNVSVSMWGEDFANYDYWISEGFKMVNNDCYPLYIVPSGHAGFVDYYDLEDLYDNWEVQYMNPSKSIVINLADPQLLGGESALWNDFKMGHSQFDDFIRMKDQIMLMAEKNWYGVKDEDQSGADFVALVEEVADYAPGANPGRFVPSVSETVASYDFETAEDGIVTDASGNGYDGVITELDVVENSGDNFLKLDGEGYLSLPFDSIGFPYTVEFQLYIDENTPENAVLFDGYDGTMYLNYDGTGKLGYERKGYSYIIDAAYETDCWIDFTLVCDRDGVSLFMDGAYAGSGEYYYVDAMEQDSSTFVLPVEEIGKGVVGYFDNLVIRNAAAAVEIDNLAYMKDVEASSLEVDWTLFAEWAVDGDPATRWSPGFNDEEWIVVDLGSVKDINKVVLNFMQEAPTYDVLISEDGDEFEVIYTGTDGCLGEAIREITFETAQARYVKYLQKEKCWIESDQAYYGSSLYELEVYNIEDGAEEVEKADTNALKVILAELAQMDFAGYTEESKAALYEQAVAAETLLIKKGLTQEEADAMVSAIEQAIEDLEYVFAIVKQPESVSVQKGKDAVVTVEATGEGLTYKWFYKNPGNKKFYDSGLEFVSEDGASYTIPMAAWRDGQEVYCVITDKNGETLQTNTVTLTMNNGSIQIVKQPESVIVDTMGDEAVITVEATGEGLTYQWYYKNPGNVKFYASGTEFVSEDGASYTISVAKWRDGQEVYCVITDANGVSVQTNTVTLSAAK